jgi:hypothetical protein
MLIPRRALLVSAAFSDRLGAAAVARELARGLRAGGAAEPDIALLDDDEIDSQLARIGFEARMRSARAVIIAVATLDPHTIVRTAAFEIATRTRQAGVPTYAVARESRIGSFDARLLDLQLVLQARSARALLTAGRRLGQVL